MSKYSLHYSKGFRKDFKSLNKDDKNAVKAVLERLANDEKLEAKFNDHQLTGELCRFRECHIKSDLLLIYKKLAEFLELHALRVGTHSKLFKK